MNQVIGKDLTFANNGSQFGGISNTPINVVFHGGKPNEVIFSSSALSQFPIPLISYAEDADFLQQAPFYIPENFENKLSTYAISETSSFILASAMGSMMLQFNWTLVGVIYSNDLYGFDGQNAVIVAQGFHPNVTISCIQILTGNKSISTFAHCVKQSNTLRVIVLWMPIATASIVAKNLTDETGYKDESVFIVPLIPFDGLSRELMPNMTFFFKPYFNRQNIFIDSECVKSGREAAGALAYNQDVDEFYYAIYKCNLTDTSLPFCPENIIERTEPCLCTGTENVSSNTK